MGINTRKTKTSNGERRSIAFSPRPSPDVREINKVVAWQKGQNPWITIANPDGARNRPYICVKANSLWGDPKKISFGIYSSVYRDDDGD